MTFAALLLHVETTPGPDPRLALAIDLANQFDAKLIGIGAESYKATTYFGGGGVDFDVGASVAADRDGLEAGLGRAEDKFRAAAVSVRRGAEWRSAIQSPPAALAAAARAADLIITSDRRRPDASQYNVAYPGVLILRAGRPVLMTPPHAGELKAASVVVAWNDTREARRAVSDALPFLRRAEIIQVVEIIDDTSALPATTSRLSEVGQYLRRHGIQATIRADIAPEEAASDRLFDIADDQTADLIVAGGYGHSRLQDLVYGSFTRALLAQTARAVFFSH